ncbi:TPA: hypothetical protein HA361_03420 [Candidatus Woesearchaeota archaeon]|nr:hypothetical protein [Candidatus Woesearchaeota archaeon]HII69325.1 hypothetical protein [Candidatus Woesearchaeota archaeon]
MHIPIQCTCKGHPGKVFCPVHTPQAAQCKVKELLTKEDFASATPAPFVGHHNYPTLNVGILSPPVQKDNTWEYDAPRHWAAHNYQIPRIVDFRSQLINSRFKADIKGNSRLLDISREVGIAKDPVDIEVSLSQKPKFRLNTDTYHAPTGPAAKLRELEVTSNPHIDSRVDKIVADTDLKASVALTTLYSKNFDENFLARALSVGSFGIGKDRKLVPTRWSITATDDTLGKCLIREIKDYPPGDYQSYFGGYLGNYFLILTFPEVWSYELFEMYLPWLISNPLKFTTDHETYAGRRDYAESTAGGYYAARLAILEKLREKKRQATVLALRFITGEYTTPLGVWVPRSAVRKAMEEKPLTFASRELLLKYAEHFVRKKFGYDITTITGRSVLLHSLGRQAKLSAFTSE